LAGFAVLSSTSLPRSQAIASATLRIALDVMGGDLGPAELVRGAIQAVREDGARVTLVGRIADIEPVLVRSGSPVPGLDVVDAPDVIEMTEQPVNAVRAKPRSSMVVAMELLRAGRADGFVSTGNTGAVMAAALFTLRRVRGVERPALAQIFPTLRGHCLLVDVGANVDCKPEHLLQFGVMGATYLERVFDRPRPRVGLLSNGEESSKGNALVRDAHPLLQASRLNFVGNVEGRDIPAHGADVVVTDGFTGNVALKLGEGCGSFLKQLIGEEARRDPISILGALLLRPALNRVSRRIDYEEYGGAPLLGVQGVCIVAHGRSNAKAIRSALRVARHAAETELPEAIRVGIEAELPRAVPTGG
jgi:glycerol-3-phosphate acyltransferase PlsX